MELTTLISFNQHLHDSHWRQQLLSSVGQLKQNDAALAIRTILNAGSEYEEWLHRDLLFAGSCLAENPPGLQEAEPELCREILQKLVELEVSERSGKRVRDRVLKILCAMKDTDFEGEALELLKERGDVIDEWRLLEYRAVLGEEEEVLRILLARLKDEDSEVRLRTASALGDFGKSSEKVVSALVSRRSDEDSEVRSSAADALGILGNSSQTVVRALLAGLEDEDLIACISAANALGKLGKTSPDVAPAIVRWIEQHRDSKDIRYGSDALWDAVVEEES